MGTVSRVFIGLGILFAILFAICVAAGACGYEANLDLTRHGRKLIGMHTQAGYQIQPHQYSHHRV